VINGPNMKKLFSQIRIELTNEQTQQLLDAADIVTYLSTLGTLIQPIPATVLGAWVGVNRVRIARANKGNGVIISIPYIHPLLRLGLLGPGVLAMMLPSGIELLVFSVRSR
jgi:hypothetical protein